MGLVQKSLSRAAAHIWFQVTCWSFCILYLCLFFPISILPYLYFNVFLFFTDAPIMVSGHSLEDDNHIDHHDCNDDKDYDGEEVKDWMIRNTNSLLLSNFCCSYSICQLFRGQR